MQSDKADQSLLARGYVVRRTFIDIAPLAPTEAPGAGGCRLRSRSCGDPPACLGDISFLSPSKHTAVPSAGSTSQGKGTSVEELEPVQHELGHTDDAKTLAEADSKQLKMVELSETPSDPSYMSECSSLESPFGIDDPIDAVNRTKSVLDLPMWPDFRATIPPLSQPPAHHDMLMHLGHQQGFQLFNSPTLFSQPPLSLEELLSQTSPVQQHQLQHQQQLHLQPQASPLSTQPPPKPQQAQQPRTPQMSRRRRSAGTVEPAVDASIPLDSVSNVHEVLHVTEWAAGSMNIADLVSALHLIAKYVDVGALGPLAAAAPAAAQEAPGCPAALFRDARFQALIVRLEALAASLDTPRSVMRTVWALGKVGARGSEVESIIVQVAKTVPPLLPQFSTQEMSNTLWGLARLASVSRGGVAGASPAAMGLTSAIIAESTARVPEFSAQCLSNSLWAVAKLELNNYAAGSFANACIDQIRRSNFSDVSPQGLANSLWAAAKLRLGQEVAVGFCVEAAGRAVAAPTLLALFQPQELSMALWAVARIVGRTTSKQQQRGRTLPKAAEAFAVAVANEAFRRLTEFGPQGLSNIAWALATMELVRHEAARRFILAAAQMSAPGLRNFPPQAIANFCWAMGRLGRAGDALAAFGAAAAQEATERSREFSWQDLSGIVSAMMHVDLARVAQVRMFAVALVHRAAGCCSEIGTQALLNIALAAVRLGVDKEDLAPMAWGIAEAFTNRMACLNDIDLRQWVEVQRYCELPGSGALGGKRAGHPGNGERGRRGGNRR